LEYYLHINPSELSDKQWVTKIAILKTVREKEAQKDETLWQTQEM
jgi:hypothetical protein